MQTEEKQTAANTRPFLAAVLLKENPENPFLYYLSIVVVKCRCFYICHSNAR